MLSLILNTAYEISDIKKKKVYHSVYSTGVLFVLYWHGGSRTLYGEKVEGIQTILQSTHAVKTGVKYVFTPLSAVQALPGSIYA